MKVAIYARVSKDDQEAENQLEQLREYCQRRDWILEHEYVDHWTGASDGRPQFQKLFHDARTRKFDLVLFWSLDRFSREGVLPTLQHLQRLNDYGVDWKSYSEQYLESLGPFREAILSVLAAMARQERIRISERTKAALERIRKSGRRLGRPPVVVDRDRIIDLRFNQRWSIRRIAKEFGVSITVVRDRIRKGRHNHKEDQT
jgi:DNA invertase Pin-like site-specific DNA recombinase